MSEQYILKIDGKIDLYAQEFDEVDPMHYLTKKDIITDFVENQLKDVNRSLFTEITKKEVIRLHTSIGMWIRNNYGLWHEQNPLTRMEGNNHPDDVSFEILEAVWDILNNSNAYGYCC